MNKENFSALCESEKQGLEILSAFFFTVHNRGLAIETWLNYLLQFPFARILFL